MSPDRGGIVALILLAAAVVAPPRAGAAKLVPDGSLVPVAIEISENLYRYYPVSAERPLTFSVEGPASFEVIARWRFEGGEAEGASPDEGRVPAAGWIDVEMEISLDGVPRTRHLFRATPGGATYADRSGARAGRAKRLALDGGVPAGLHVVSIALVQPLEGVLDVNALSVPAARSGLAVVGEVEFGASYDSNIFRYSDGDIDDLLDGERLDRFLVESADDLRLEPGVTVSLVRNGEGTRSTTLSVGSDLRLATSNGEKSFGKVLVGLRERRAGAAYLALEYEAIPDYHIRALWDEDAAGHEGAYRSCDFWKQGFGVEMGSDRSLPIDVAVRWRYEAYRYDPDFVEYDARVGTLGALATVRPRRGLRLDLGYALRQSVAKGYDERGETRSSSDESDTSYDQDQYELRARWEAGELWERKAALWLRGLLARRFYLTEKSGEDDPYHAGRDDTYLTVGAGLDVRLTETARLEVFAERRTREAHSDAVPDMGLTKDFEAVSVGLRLSLEGVRILD
jgi:hypothetical protein